MSHKLDLDDAFFGSPGLGEKFVNPSMVTCLDHEASLKPAISVATWFKMRFL